MKRITGKAIKSIKLDTQIKNDDLVRRKRLHIATEASKLFIQKGYHRTNIRDISKATGMTIGSLYDYITKKEDILCLVFDVFHSLVEEIFREAGLFKIRDPVEQLRASVCKTLEMSETYHDMVALIFSESKSLPKKFLKSILQRESIKVRYFERILRKGMASGVFDVKDPVLESNMMAYLLTIVPLRGWNFEKGYTVAEMHGYLTESIMARVCRTTADRHEARE